MLLLLSSLTAHGEVFVPDWSEIGVWPFPLSPNGTPNPVLTKYDVGPGCGLVADPFLFHDCDRWYMFFESYHGAGEIGLAISDDGLNWSFDSVVLDPAFHVSYPCVFRCGRDYYMVVEASVIQSVPLYKAEHFPYDWTRIGTIAAGRPFSDPTVFYHHGSWWMFVSRPTNDVCYLYYADELTGPWIEHPQSPVVTDTWRSRPAGRPVALSQGRLLRLGQDCNPTYGEGVRAFAVDVLTRTAYAEHEVPDSPILFRSGSGWNANGMHSCDLWWHENQWIAAVDGIDANGCWSIGIYWGQGESSSVDAAEPIGRWRLVPNPSRGDQPMHVFATSGGATGCDRIEIFDAGGRLRRSMPVENGSDRIEFSWGDPGGVATPGVYLLRASLHGSVVGTGRGIVVR